MSGTLLAQIINLGLSVILYQYIYDPEEAAELGLFARIIGVGAAIATARYDKTAEVYVEINKQLGVSGTTYYYDRVAYVGRVMNYSESYPADNLVQVSFDLMSRGPVAAGQITISGASKLPTGPNT